MAQEAGYQGRLVSLGGVVGAPGRGRQARQLNNSVDNTGTKLIMESNPKRLSALIQNIDAINMYIMFGDELYNYGFLLRPYDIFQIDQNLPWAGSVAGYAAAACTYRLLEVSVP